MNSWRLPPCRASYKYIDECRLPKYFTVRPITLNCMRSYCALASAPCPPAAPATLAPLSPPGSRSTHGRSFAQVERVQEVARQCLSTLVCLHKHGVIHCDLVRRTHRALRPKRSP